MEGHASRINLPPTLSDIRLLLANDAAYALGSSEEGFQLLKLDASSQQGVKILGIHNSHQVEPVIDVVSDSILLCAREGSKVTCHDKNGGTQVISQSAQDLLPAAGQLDLPLAFWLQESGGFRLFSAKSSQLCEQRSTNSSANPSNTAVGGSASPFSLATISSDSVELQWGHELYSSDGLHTGRTLFMRVLIGHGRSSRIVARLLTQSATGILTSRTYMLPEQPESSSSCRVRTLEPKHAVSKSVWSRDESFASVSAIVTTSAPPQLMSKYLDNSADFPLVPGHDLTFADRLVLQAHYIRTSLLQVLSRAAAVGVNFFDTNNFASPSASLPAVDSIGVVLSRPTAGDPVLHALDLHDGRTLWSVQFGQQDFRSEQDLMFIVRHATSNGSEPQIAYIQRHRAHSRVSWIGAWSGRVLHQVDVDFDVSHASRVDTDMTNSKFGLIMLLSQQEDGPGMSEGKVEIVPLGCATLPLDVTFAVQDKSSHQQAAVAGKKVTVSKEFTSSRFEVKTMWKTLVQTDGVPPFLAAAGQTLYTSGEALSDDSVLIKFPIRSLLAIVSVSSTGVTCRIIDVRSGRTLFSQFHEGRAGPAKATQNDHTFYFSMWDTKTAQAEMHVVALYAGALGKAELGPWPWQSAARSTVLSEAIASGDPAVVKTASFVLPKTATGLYMSSTKNSLAQRYLLVSTASGSVWAVADKLVDPRRPRQGASVFEKSIGLLPFDPTLSFGQHTSVFKAMKPLAVQMLRSAPCSMESCSIVIAAGIDVAACELWQSRPFDQLPEDFNAVLLVLLMLCLSLATVVLKSRLGLERLSASWQ